MTSNKKNLENILRTLRTPGGPAYLLKLDRISFWRTCEKNLKSIKQQRNLLNCDHLGLKKIQDLCVNMKHRSCSGIFIYSSNHLFTTEMCFMWETMNMKWITGCTWGHHVEKWWLRDDVIFRRRPRPVGVCLSPDISWTSQHDKLPSVIRMISSIRVGRNTLKDLKQVLTPLTRFIQTGKSFSEEIWIRNNKYCKNKTIHLRSSLFSL